MNRMACNLVMRRISVVGVGRTSNVMQTIIPRVCVSHSATTMRQKESWGDRTQKQADELVTKQQRNFNAMKKQFEKELDERYAGVHRESAGEIIDPYTPSPSVVETTKRKGRALYAYRMLKKEDKSREPFDKGTVAKQAQKKFIDLNNELQKKTFQKTSELRTREWATAKMVDQLKQYFRHPNKIPYWRFEKEVEPPKIIHIAVSKDEMDELTAQLTVEMNTMQIRAMKDQHGRVIKGCLKTPQPVKNLIVIEKYLPDPYGRWRICGQI